MGAKFVVTGGAGFIGSHIVRRLVAQGYKVTVVDNLSSGSIDNLSEVLATIEFVKGDVRDPNLLKELFVGATAVIHEAALSSVPASVAKPVETNDINVYGTLNMLVASRDCGVRRVVMASSSAVYGESGSSPKCEDMTPNPLSPYAVSKYIGELYARTFTSLYGLETVCLRYFNVFGPGQRVDSEYAAVIPQFLSMVLGGGRPRVYGSGT
jgi:UDP-glucose 4-epimerase